MRSLKMRMAFMRHRSKSSLVRAISDPYILGKCLASRSSIKSPVKPKKRGVYPSIFCDILNNSLILMSFVTIIVVVVTFSLFDSYRLNECCWIVREVLNAYWGHRSRRSILTCTFPYGSAFIFLNWRLGEGAVEKFGEHSVIIIEWVPGALM